MSQQDRGRGSRRGGFTTRRGSVGIDRREGRGGFDGKEWRGGFDGREGRGGFAGREERDGFYSSSPQPYHPVDTAYPGSSYPPSQFSSSGIHSAHPYQPTVNPPSVHYQPTVNPPSVHYQPTVSPLPPQYPSQSVISVAVIQSPTGQYYSERHPVQSPAYFQPNTGGPIPPKYENLVPIPYPRGDRYTSDPPYQKHYDGGNLPQRYDHSPDTDRRSSQSYSTSMMQEHDQHTGQQMYYNQQRTYNQHTGQQMFHNQQRAYDQHSGQQMFHNQQRTYDQHTGQQKYHDPQQVHSVQAGQKKADCQQKKNFSKSQKHRGLQQKSGLSKRQIPASRNQSTPEEPPPPYDSLSFQPGITLQGKQPGITYQGKQPGITHQGKQPRITHQRKQPGITHQGKVPGITHEGKEPSSPCSKMEDKTGKKFRESKPQNKSRDKKSQNLQAGLASADSSNPQHLLQDRKDFPELYNKNMFCSQGQSSQDSRNMSNNISGNMPYHKKKSGSSQGDRSNSCEGIMLNIGLKPQFSASCNLERPVSASSNLERPVSTSTRGRERKKERGYFQGKGKKNDRNNLDKINLFENTDNGIIDNLLDKNNQLKSGVIAEVNEQEGRLAHKKKPRARNRRKKANSLHITKACLQIQTSFKDAASLKTTVELFTDKSETHCLQFVDDSIICSEKRSVCTVMISACNSRVGKHVISDLCERLKKNLNIKVMYYISSVAQTQSLESDNSQSKAPLAGNNEETSKQVLDNASIPDRKNISGAETESNQSVLPGTVPVVGTDIAEKNIEVSDVDNSEVSDADDSEVSDADDSEVSDVDDSEVSDVDNSEVSDADDSEVSDVDNSEISDVDNSEVSLEEDDEGTFERNNEGSEEEEDECSVESNNEGQYEDIDGPDGGGNEGPDGGDNEGLFEDSNQGVDKENSELLEEVYTESLNEKDNAGQEIKLTVVVNKVFTVKADFLELLTTICGDVSVFKLVPDSVVMATSTTLCELLVPSKLDAKKLVQQIYSSKLTDMHVHCFTVTDGAGSV